MAEMVALEEIAIQVQGVVEVVLAVVVGMEE